MGALSTAQKLEDAKRKRKNEIILGISDGSGASMNESNADERSASMNEGHAQKKRRNKSIDDNGKTIKCSFADCSEVCKRMDKLREHTVTHFLSKLSEKFHISYGDGNELTCQECGNVYEHYRIKRLAAHLCFKHNYIDKCDFLEPSMVQTLQSLKLGKYSKRASNKDESFISNADESTYSEEVLNPANILDGLNNDFLS